MSEERRSNQLSLQTVDYAAAAIRAGLGAVPFAGSLLVELADIIIPNQQIDRLIRFAETLECKLSSLEQNFVRSQLTNENFTDLLEEGLRQAARSLSDERREYIANLIANSLSQEDIEYIESKHLMRMLAEINDIEVIWLRFHLVATFGGDEEFRSKHANVLEPVVATFSDPPVVLDKQSLQMSYREHLVRLGLLQPRYKTDPGTRTPQTDRFTGALEVAGYQITHLGRLLLQHIGLSDPEK